MEVKNKWIIANGRCRMSKGSRKSRQEHAVHVQTLHIRFDFSVFSHTVAELKHVENEAFPHTRFSVPARSVAPRYLILPRNKTHVLILP